MSQSLYILTICLFLGTILLVFGMRFLSAFLQARARLANDDAYRLIAEKAVAIQSSLADIKGRLASVEKILKEVE